jgi:hypothetical protein
MKRQIVDWKQRASRRSASLTGSAHRSDGSAVRVLITNISYGGCHVLAEGELEAGEALTLAVTNSGRMKAQVRWVTGDQAGLTFVAGVSAVENRRLRLGV